MPKPKHISLPNQGSDELVHPPSLPRDHTQTYDGI